MSTRRLPYQDGDPSLRHFQHLEDLATAYWYSEVLFAAMSLRLFDAIDADGTSTEAIARTAACRVAPLARLLRALEDLDLVQRLGSGWVNSQLAGRYLISGRPDYMGEFLLYRRYYQPRWQELARQTAKDPKRAASSFHADGPDRRRGCRHRPLGAGQVPFRLRRIWKWPAVPAPRKDGHRNSDAAERLPYRTSAGRRAPVAPISPADADTGKGRLSGRVPQGIRLRRRSLQPM